MGTAPAHAFQAETHAEDDDLVRLRLSGELDIATLPTFARALARAEERRPLLLVLDLADLRFLAACGLRSVAIAAARARRAHRRFVVVNVRPEICKLFAMLGLDQMIDIHERWAPGGSPTRHRPAGRSRSTLL